MPSLLLFALIYGDGGGGDQLPRLCVRVLSIPDNIWCFIHSEFGRNTNKKGCTVRGRCLRVEEAWTSCWHRLPGPARPGSTSIKPFKVKSSTRKKDPKRDNTTLNTKINKERKKEKEGERKAKQYYDLLKDNNGLYISACPCLFLSKMSRLFQSFFFSDYQPCEQHFQLFRRLQTEIMTLPVFFLIRFLSLFPSLPLRIIIIVLSVSFT